ncbi:transcription factor AP-4 [Homalodisca vitripennis]|uniref:transcription factor AP-4 n=1 Tax=Homalodisca vitripennis TaxID=197043 RepID=UPI001EEB2C8A|nr:transcription factor AP-4 [Homalodisca vitripennis]
MSTLSRSEEKIRLEDLQQYDQDDIGYCSLERPDSPTLRTHHGSMEQEKRIRREIANSNERRRMQSINAGFQSLRTLLPHHEGEKLSKAAILQQTAEYIYQLEQEKTRLLSQNCQLKRLINQHEGESNSAAKKRKTESGLVVSVADEVVTSDGAVTGAGAVAVGGAGSPTLLDIEQAGANSELIDLRVQLDRERGLRMILEDQVRSLETQLYPERIREITQQVQLQFSQQQQEEEPLAAGLLTPLRRESQSSTGSESVGQETASAVATLQVVSAASLQPVSHTETVIATTPSPPTSPSPATASRLPTMLESAIKAEPKVEVERLSSPSGTNGEEVVPQARVYLASTSRQNLETIVEAIRHLEGDAFISDSGTEVSANSGTTGTTQESPLALTKQQRLLKVEMNPFLQFHSHPHPQQQRPGVIVVKQHT